MYAGGDDACRGRQGGCCIALRRLAAEKFGPNHWVALISREHGGPPDSGCQHLSVLAGNPPGFVAAFILNITLSGQNPIENRGFVHHGCFTYEFKGSMNVTDLGFMGHDGEMHRWDLVRAAFFFGTRDF